MILLRQATIPEAPLPPAAADNAGRGVAIGIAAYALAVAAGWWIVLHLLPDAISFKLFGHAVALANLRHRVLDRSLWTAVIIPAIFAAELASVGWRKSSLHDLAVARTRSSATDFISFLLIHLNMRTILTVIFSLGVALISGSWLHDRLREATGLSLTLSPLPFALQIFTGFLIYSFFDYWQHRIDHTHYFWPLHRFHHAAEDSACSPPPAPIRRCSPRWWCSAFRWR